MRRRKKYYHKKDSLSDIFSGIIALAILGLIFKISTNPTGFMQSLMPFIGIVFLIVFVIVAWKIIQRKLNNKRIDNLFQSIQERNLENSLINFINRFSFESKTVEGWTFRNHRIAWDRIHDLEKSLINQGINLKTGKDGDIFVLLRHYIQQKEENLTTESIKSEPQRFATLSGDDFEKLLYLLFEKMGYKVEHIGRSGDQGGDLIANRNGERILIQAKCYRDWSTGNAAVQQVAGALQYYSCNRAMVITTSYFTPEAISLAKANKIELISKEQLQELLLKYLGESWF